MATKTLKTSRSLQTMMEKRVSTGRSSESRRNKSYPEKPSPLDFDTFIPWICMEWEVPEVITIIRLTLEKLSRNERRRSSSAKYKYIKNAKLREEEVLGPQKTSVTTTGITSSSIENTVPIKAFYDSNSHLAELVIDNCVYPLHRKVIKAISLCIPFHSFLNKLVVRKEGLNYIVLHEISKLLPYSNITNICLDDTYVPEGNYYELLDHASNLKSLSLSRCNINDKICNELASRIDFGRNGEKSLAILNLSSNLITDVGAQYFGNILRKNRHLLHLNLLGNKIGDKGFYCLMKHLQEFPMTFDEIIERKRRNYQYYQKKNEIFQKCFEEILQYKKSDSESMPSEKRSSFSNKLKKIKKPKKSTYHLIEPEHTSNTDIAEKMTREIIGEFNDPFNKESCIIKNKYDYSMGNLKLCSLNVAYNNLEFLSLLKVLNVLKYQSGLNKSVQDTGLIRLVLEGNNFPNSCPELERINMYLKNALETQVSINNPMPTTMKRRTSFYSSRQR